MASVQLRAIRNGVVAAAVTAVVGFTLNAMFTSAGTTAGDGSPTPSRSPACRAKTTPLDREALRGLTGRILDLWIDAPNDGWVVGAAGDPASNATAVLARWDGSVWTASGDGLQTTTIEVLEGVGGSSADDVWAVGWSSDGFGRDTLAAHFDGTTWQRSTSPTDAVLFDVVAVAPNDVWAVGSAGDPELVDERALALHWDGAAWSEAALPVGGGRSGLLSIDGTFDDLWAVGYHHHGPLLLHYDGTSWERTLEIDARGSLNAVSVIGDTVWLAGSSVLRGDGSNFDEVAEAPKGGTFSAVLATGSTRAWVVGSITDGDVSRSLAALVTGTTTQRARVRASGSDDLDAVAIVGGDGLVAGSHETARGTVPLIATLQGCA